MFIVLDFLVFDFYVFVPIFDYFTLLYGLVSCSVLSVLKLFYILHSLMQCLTKFIGLYWCGSFVEEFVSS